MKRRVVWRAVRVGLWLLTGAMMSIAAAWGIVIWHEFDAGDPGRVVSFAIPNRGAEGEEMLVGSIEHYFGMAVYSATRTAPRRMPQDYATRDVALPGWCELPPDGTGEMRGVLAAGFPFLCMKFKMVDNPGQAFRVTDALSLPMLRKTPLIWVPRRPMCLRLFINSLVYAMAMFLVFRGTHALVRHRRTRRGHCPFCNYDVRGVFSQPCSECGKIADGLAVSVPLKANFRAHMAL